MYATLRPLQRRLVLEISTAPPIPHLRMYPRMTSFAQRHQVLCIVSSAMREWQFVMYLLGWRVTSLLQTHLTQWVSRRIVVTDTFPRSAVTLAWAVLSAVAFVLFVGKLGMLLAVAVMRKFRTVRIGTRVCRLCGHKIISNRKSPAFARLFTIFSIIQYITLGAVQTMANRVTFRGRQSFSVLFYASG